MNFLCIHHTAISHALNKTQLYAVDRYHKEKFAMRSREGWWVCYNDFIDADGTLTHTRHYDEETCAVVGHNCDTPARCDTMSVCLTGNFDVEYPTQSERTALKNYIAAALKKYPGIQIIFHRKLQANRTCPGALLTQEYLNALIRDALVTPVDDAAKEKIAALAGRLDTLRALLARLLALLKK